MTTQTVVPALREGNKVGLALGRDAIAAGDILVQRGIKLPASVLVETQPDSSGWTTIKDNHSTFEKAVEEAGWTLFFMAGEIKATVFGFDRQKALSLALKRLIVNVESQHCNSLEITRIISKSFLSLPYVTVSAHLRHLQKSSLFSG